MLRSVVLHQGRLETPGLWIGEQGVVMGRWALARLPHLPAAIRLVAALGQTERSGALEDFSLRRMQDLGSQVAVKLALGPLSELDQLARLTLALGGKLFVGSGSHWVPARDAEAPFGYEAPRPEPPKADSVLYEGRGAIHVRWGKELGLAELSQILPVVGAQAGERGGAGVGPGKGASWAHPEGTRRIGLLVQRPLLGATLTYLRRRGLGAQARFQAQGRWVLLTGITLGSGASLAGLSQVPGVWVLENLEAGDVWIEAGFASPLGSAARSQPNEALVLRHGEPSVTFANAAEVVDLSLAGADDAGILPARPSQATEEFAASLAHGRAPFRLRRCEGILGGQTAVYVGDAQLPLALRVLWTMPWRQRAHYELCALSSGAILRGPAPAHWLPLGQRLWMPDEGLLLPLRMALPPGWSPAEARQAHGCEAGQTLVFLPGENEPLRLGGGAFGPLPEPQAAVEVAELAEGDPLLVLAPPEEWKLRHD